MAAPSPSEFLTFYRRAASPAVLRRAVVSRPQTRSFMASLPARNAKEEGGHVFSTKDTQQEKGPGQGTGASREHTLDKAEKKDPNIQSYESSAGQRSRAQDVGGQATRQKDERNSKEKAKQEFPEAPTTIGMEDERGGKGA